MVWDMLDDGKTFLKSDSDYLLTESVIVFSGLAIFWTELVRSVIG